MTCIARPHIAQQTGLPPYYEKILPREIYASSKNNQQAKYHHYRHA